MKNLIIDLEKLSTKEKAPIWKAVAKILNSGSRRRPNINIEKINKVLKKGEIGLIPGKLLSVGEDQGHEVAVYQVSEAAAKKVKNVRGIRDLMKKNPKGKKVRIIC